MTGQEGATRSYIAIGLAAVLVMTSVLGLRSDGGLLVAFLPGLFALLGLFGGYTLFPILALFGVCYLVIYPLGMPITSGREIREASHFRLMDLILVGSVLIYFIALYRANGLRYQAMPADLPPMRRSKPDQRIRRPEAHVDAAEIPALFFLVAGVLVVGQVVWLLLVHLQAVPHQFPPIAIVDFSSDVRPNSTQEVLLTAGFFVSLFLAAFLVFWYWRWSSLNGLEARLFLLDSQWQFSRREMSRQETWRAWALPKPVDMNHTADQRAGCGRFSLKLLLLILVMVLLALVGWLVVIGYLINRM